MISLQTASASCPETAPCEFAAESVKERSPMTESGVRVSADQTDRWPRIDAGQPDLRTGRIAFRIGRAPPDEDYFA